MVTSGIWRITPSRRCRSPKNRVACEASTRRFKAVIRSLCLSKLMRLEWGSSLKRSVCSSTQARRFPCPFRGPRLLSTDLLGSFQPYPSTSILFVLEFREIEDTSRANWSTLSKDQQTYRSSTIAYHMEYVVFVCVCFFLEPRTNYHYQKNNNCYFIVSKSCVQTAVVGGWRRSVCQSAGAAHGSAPPQPGA